MQIDDEAHGPAMLPLHPNQLWVLRVRGLITAVPILLAAVMADLGPLRETPVPPGAVGGGILVALLASLIVLPPRRYRAWAYREEADELHIRSGLLVRSSTVVPFGRVQHIDVTHGPVERRFGLATLVLHTAGTRGASVPLPGLLQAEAEAMRDRIRAKIRQDLV
ncbi:PH domain-containing protein [Sphingosinicella terrae]|jgi:uncharacterized protein|uniref:PH domain-containing protein n=1 Tax=Sphingosinicella terrae TaxID=2172047 RepID=UPI0025476CC6|nr:PH domain-containing protein [Sphingosinicella terrae]